MSNKQWHRNVGVEIDPCTNLDEQLEAAGLAWRVEQSSYCYGPSFEFEDTDNTIAYRSDTGAVLGYFGPYRKVFQNREVLEAFHAFVGNSGDGLQIERLGCLNGGKSLFATARLKHDIDVKKVGDVLETRLLLTEHHVSGRALQVRLYFNRLICTNGMTTLVKVAGRTLNHMQEFNADSVREYLEEAYQNIAKRESVLNRLAEVSVSDAEARMHLVKAFGSTEFDWEDQPKAVQTCYRLFKGEGFGSEKLSAFQTLFGLHEAVSEYQNWHMRGSYSAKAFQSVVSGSRGQRQNAFMHQLVSVHL
jgi:phage/plasmid-like protein (TIGR03299 family)